jgi:hypothetical protein
LLPNGSLLSESNYFYIFLVIIKSSGSEFLLLIISQDKVLTRPYRENGKKNISETRYLIEPE